MSDSVALAIAKFADGVSCTPPDEIFADKNGKVVDSATPKLFVGATLVGRFHIERYIESGAFGRGWVATDKTQGDKQVFLKTFRSVLDRPGPVDPRSHETMVNKEIGLLLQAAKHKMPPHPNIVGGNEVHYGDIVVPSTGRKGEMFFVVSPDLCEGGELYNYLVFGNGIKKFSEKIARYFFKQLAEGVGHMHKNGIFHRDLKLENIVLDSHYVAKIMDFGHAKHASECSTTVDKATGVVQYETETFVGTASYQPPELRAGSSMYNPAAFDVWSLGVILFFLVGIEGLAARGNDFTFISKVKANVKGYNFLDQKRDDQGVPMNAKLWEWFGPHLQFSPELKHLINAIFDRKATSRYTIDKVLAHPWLKGEMPSEDEVVAALSGRSNGIVERDFVFSLADKYPDQKTTLNAVEAAVKKVAPGNYKMHGHKIGVKNPPHFALAVGENRKVRVMWLTGGLAEWLEFRHLLGTKLDFKL